MEARRPFELIRELQDMQDGLSRGVAMQEGASDRVVAGFENAVRDKATDWGDRRNRSALIFFLLTGGDVEAVRPALDAIPKTSRDRAIVEATLSYARPAQGGSGAESDVAAIDPRDASPEAGAALALAQARLLVDYDSSAAMEKLQVARMLAPGGFIEDMALRQEIQLLGDGTDLSVLQRIAQRYLTCFAKSVFAESFIQQLGASMARLWKIADPGRRTALTGILKEMPAAQRSRISRALARASLLRGERDGALQLLEAGCGSATPVPDARAQCTLYRRLAGQFAEGAEVETSQAESAGLDAIDRMIQACARMLAGAGVPASENESDRSKLVQPEPAQPASEATRRIRERLARTDRYLSSLR